MPPNTLTGLRLRASKIWILTRPHIDHDWTCVGVVCTPGIYASDLEAGGDITGIKTEIATAFQAVAYRHRRAHETALELAALVKLPREDRREHLLPILAGSVFSYDGTSLPGIAASGRVYVSDWGRGLHVLDAATTELIRTVPVPHPVGAPVAFGGRLYVNSSEGKLNAITVTPPPRERGGFSLGRVGVATDQPGP